MIAIILASGFSRRMGKNKLLLPYKGKLILKWVIEGALDLKLDRVILVYKEEAVKKLCENLDVELIYNVDAVNGQSASVVKGVKAADEFLGDYLFLMGDQPLLNVEEIRSMINAYKNSNKSIGVPLYNEVPGTPVIFSRKWRNQLLSLTGDSGGRTIIKKNKEEIFFYPIKNRIMGFDIDTEEDYAELLKQKNKL